MLIQSQESGSGLTMQLNRGENPSLCAKDIAEKTGKDWKTVLKDIVRLNQDYVDKANDPNFTHIQSVEDAAKGGRVDLFTLPEYCNNVYQPGDNPKLALQQVAGGGQAPSIRTPTTVFNAGERSAQVLGMAQDEIDKINEMITFAPFDPSLVSPTEELAAASADTTGSAVLETTTGVIAVPGPSPASVSTPSPAADIEAPKPPDIGRLIDINDEIKSLKRKFKNPDLYEAIINGDVAISGTDPLTISYLEPGDDTGERKPSQAEAADFKSQEAYDTVTSLLVEAHEILKVIYSAEPQVEFTHLHLPSNIPNPANDLDGFRAWCYENTELIMLKVESGTEVTQQNVDDQLAEIDRTIALAKKGDEEALGKLHALYDNVIPQTGNYKDWCEDNLGPDAYAVVRGLIDLAEAGDSVSQARYAELGKAIDIDLLPEADLAAIAKGETTLFAALAKSWDPDTAAKLTSPFTELDVSHIEEFEANPDQYVTDRVDSAAYQLKQAKLKLRLQKDYDHSRPITDYSAKELEKIGVSLLPDARHLAGVQDRGSAYLEISQALPAMQEKIKYGLLAVTLMKADYVPATQALLAKAGIELSERAIITLRVASFGNYAELDTLSFDRQLSDFEFEFGAEIRHNIEMLAADYHLSQPKEEEAPRIAAADTGADKEEKT